MAHRITPDNDYDEGESVTWEFTIEENGSAKDISGYTPHWYLLPTKGDANADATLDETDTGVSITIVDATAGRVDLEMDRGVTDTLSGSHWHRIVLDDTGSGRQKWSGPFPINEA